MNHRAALIIAIVVTRNECAQLHCSCNGLSCCPAADNVVRAHPYVGSPGALPNLADYKLMSLSHTLGINIQDALKDGVEY